LNNSLHLFLKSLLDSFRDLLPLVLVIVFFKLFVLQQMPADIFQILVGLMFVVVGLTFFIFGLQQGLFPIGESMAEAFAKKGSVFWLLAFSFCLGFGTTIAEPTLIAIASEASKVAAQAGVIELTEQAKDNYANGLRLTVAFSVGVAIALGVLRILLNWPIHYMIMTGYILVIVMTGFAPDEIIGIAYDSGGVTTSTITVPLVTALGVGLASSISGRNPFTDGFGLIAFASLLPIVFVLVYGMVI
jgi:hypothetical protein